MFISVGDGVVTKTLLLVNLRITEVNPETATAYGVAPPNTTFNVDVDTCVGNCGDFVSAYPVVSNSKGAWTANFGTLGVDFGPITGNDLGANISDNDGDNTIFDVGVPPTVGDLSAEVNALVPQAQRQPLLQVLQTAHQLLLQNKVSSAIGQLRSFESQVRSLVRSKKLSAASGDQLIGLAEQLIGGLQGCC